MIDHLSNFQICASHIKTRQCESHCIVITSARPISEKVFGMHEEMLETREAVVENRRKEMMSDLLSKENKSEKSF